MSTQDVASLIRIEIDRNGGRTTLARFMELALYDPEHGYYMLAERKPGRGGDFLTSPEASPLFGITLARQIAECWERLNRPVGFSIREYGSGVGGLAYDVLAGLSELATDCFSTVTYRLVERNPHRQAEALAAFREVGLIDRIVAESEENLEPITGVVIANEVADAFPAHRLIGQDGGFVEAWIVSDSEGCQFEHGPLSPGGETAARTLQSEGVRPVQGGIYDVSPAAAAWFGQATGLIEAGYAIVIDYGYEASELFTGHKLNGTLRGYSEHTVTDDPFIRIGEQDLTTHVDFTALRKTAESAGGEFCGLTTQGAFLSSLGLGDHLMTMQSEPGVELNEYMATQAVVLRLIDPGGLGRFRVLIMARDAPVNPPLLGFTIPGPSF